MNYAIVFDPKTNTILGSKSYTETPEQYPANEFPCTQAQAQNPTLWQLVGGVLVQSLAAAQAAQIEVLKTACAKAITGGYVSSALGSAHTYPSTPTDQLNMAASVIASQLPGIASTWTTVFWCQDSTGAWAMLPHTAAQIQQAGSDGKAWVTTQQLKLASLSAQVMAATTVAAVEAVVW